MKGRGPTSKGRGGEGGEGTGGERGRGEGKEEGDGRNNPKPAATGLYKPQISSLAPHLPPDVTILGHKVDVVDSFVCLGSSIDASGGNDSDIRRRIEPARIHA